MRGIAIAFALLYHAEVPLAGGGYVGIEIFFVLSGFLITGLLVAELEGTGALSLRRFYAYRVKRLLPLAAVTLATIAVVSAALFSPVRNDIVSGDVVSAALYVINWRYTAQSVDYFATGLDASPVQHFWSLAIEEQFYIVWPVLLVAATWLPRRAGGTIRPALWIAVAAVALGSFAYNLKFTAEAPSAAYFSTLTRSWELALGGALALIALPKLSPRVAGALAVAGVGALAYSVLAFGDETPYPGTAALIPTTATVALIVAGAAPVSPAPVRLLAWGPVRYVGRISYAWYLWHWPTLIFATAVFGSLSVAGGLLVVLASAVPTITTHHLIERPVRYSRALGRHPRRTLVVGAACTASAVFAGLLLFASQPKIPTAPLGDVEGARALSYQTEPQEKASALHPNPRAAGDDRSVMHEDGCLAEFAETGVKPCEYGNPSAPTSVVLFGDSTALQFGNPMVALARRHDWRLVGIAKAGCTVASTEVYSGKLERPYRECDEWRESALERIEEVEPDLVVVSTSSRHKMVRDGEPVEGAERVAALESGYVETLERLRGTGARVAVIAELPRPPQDPPDCVAGSLDRLRECAFPRADDPEAFARRAASRVGRVDVLDPGPVVCPDGMCRPVIGDALVYRDRDHLTGTFARTLAPWMERQLPRLR
jgi:peptidoglycan/LPS O-acetylase OafA/YrhL